MSAHVCPGGATSCSLCRPVRTRDILRWHYSIPDLAHLTALITAGLVLGVLDRACTEVERWIERRGS